MEDGVFSEKSDVVSLSMLILLILPLARIIAHGADSKKRPILAKNLKLCRDRSSHEYSS
jgi:hypothetical protein